MKLDEPFKLSSTRNDTPSLAGIGASRDGIHVTLPDVSGLECLPVKGKITFEFDREDLHVRKDALSASICLTAITHVECDESAEEEDKLSDVVDKLFEEAAESEKDEGDGE